MFSGFCRFNRPDPVRRKTFFYSFDWIFFVSEIADFNKEWEYATRYGGLVWGPKSLIYFIRNTETFSSVLHKVIKLSFKLIQ